MLPLTKRFKKLLQKLCAKKSSLLLQPNQGAHGILFVPPGNLHSHRLAEVLPEHSAFNLLYILMSLAAFNLLRADDLLWGLLLTSLKMCSMLTAVSNQMNLMTLKEQGAYSKSSLPDEVLQLLAQPITCAHLALKAFQDARSGLKSR